MEAASQTLSVISKKGPQLLWLLGLFLLFWDAPAHSQSLGDIARQERQRKQEQPPPTAHVYDNDDLARQQILLPEDRERYQASKQKVTPAASEPAVVSMGSKLENDARPLGDIARQERQRKQEQPPRTTHVYRNGDLARSQILVPEDRERFQAAKQKVTLAPSELAEESAGRILENNAEPLGDIARRYRALEKAGQDLESQSRRLLPDLSPLVLAYPAFSRPPVNPSQPPAPLRSTNNQKGPFGKAISREEISGSRRVCVQPGDTLWRLAGRYLGRGKDWLLLAAGNPQVTDPKRLQIGAWLRLPDEAPHHPPPRQVRVKRGDSLWKLTQSKFGNAGTWSCMAQANPQIRDTNLIFPGQILTIPESCTTPLPQGHRLTVSSASVMPKSTSW
jgi:nucleoid-associated protein YgaU